MAVQQQYGIAVARCRTQQPAAQHCAVCGRDACILKGGVIACGDLLCLGEVPGSHGRPGWMQGRISGQTASNEIGKKKQREQAASCPKNNAFCFHLY